MRWGTFIALNIINTLDLAVSGIKDRLDQTGYATYKTLQVLLLKAANTEDCSVRLHEVMKQYRDHLDESGSTTKLQTLSAKFITEAPVNLKKHDFLRSLSAGQRTFVRQVRIYAD